MGSFKLISKNFKSYFSLTFEHAQGNAADMQMNNKNDLPLDVVQCCLLFPTQLSTGTLLPCSVLILSMAKNQSDIENLVKNCLSPISRIRLKMSAILSLISVALLSQLIYTVFQFNLYDLSKALLSNWVNRTLVNSNFQLDVGSSI